MKNSFYGHAVQIAGSIADSISDADAEHAHTFVRHLAKKLISKDSTLVTMADEEPRICGSQDRCSKVFYWDVLDEVYEASSDNRRNRSRSVLAHVACSSQSLRRIPAARREMWTSLLKSKAISLHKIPENWTSSYLIREKQESLSDALVIVGGQQGVEQSVSMFQRHGKLILPFDFPLGDSSGRDSCAAERCYEMALSRPGDFVPDADLSVTSELVALSHENWVNKPSRLADRTVGLLQTLLVPKVFCIRLMNEEVDEHDSVEWFFEKVVIPVASLRGYSIHQVSRGRTSSQFLNTEIVRGLNRSSIVVADMTGNRMNCYFELGYGFGIGRKVLVTAIRGTKMPFDTDKIPCMFWSKSDGQRELMRKLETFWKDNIDRAPMTMI